VKLARTIPQGLKPHIDFAGFMYGLKPVPFPPAGFSEPSYEVASAGGGRGAIA
jgi:hypothetical protein